ncbi:unnamed protein product [Larinioides sclopetarius]|uniref:Uncharacterized protein n=1 Tax=Larinioides sclopetarius TaxID=280406 RepID=A0AAV2BSB8_9ARAC
MARQSPKPENMALQKSATLLWRNFPSPSGRGWSLGSVLNGQFLVLSTVRHDMDENYQKRDGTMWLKNTDNRGFAIFDLQ